VEQEGLEIQIKTHRTGIRDVFNRKKRKTSKKGASEGPKHVDRPQAGSTSENETVRSSSKYDGTGEGTIRKGYEEDFHKQKNK